MNEIIKIIQVSDLHCGPRARGIDAQARSLVQRALPLFVPPPIRRQITRRIAGHDPTTWKELRSSVRDETAKDSWPLTWLVATGDLSTWGDDASLTQSLAQVQTLAQEAHAQQMMILYGNHDAWVGSPGQLRGFPLFTHPNDLNIHRSGLHAGAFQQPCPEVAHAATLPDGRRLFIAAVNTIEHEPVRNAIARGRVRAERYWEAPPGPDQLRELAALASRDDVVVVALTHHPVHADTALRHLAPLAPLVLSNPNDVAAALTSSHADRPCIVLSGHTHVTFPDFGDSTEAQPHPTHPPLLANHVQFVAGTASQAQFGSNGERKPHVWQQIQIYASTTHLRIERIVFARWNGVGGFTPVTTNATDPDAIADVYELPL